MTVPIWPILQLEPERPHWEIATGQVTGGQNLEGWTQTGIFGGGGFWRLALNRIVIVDDLDQRISWRALQALTDGGGSPVEIAYPDYALMEELSPSASIPSSRFLDGSEYSDTSQTVSGSVRVLNVGIVGQNATVMTVNEIYGPPLLPGMDFSVRDGQGCKRRHRIKRATAIVGEPGSYTLTIRPWLRDVVLDGAELDFLNPGSVMFLADAASIFADETGSRFAEVSPVFSEWFGTVPS